MFFQTALYSTSEEKLCEKLALCVFVYALYMFTYSLFVINTIFKHYYLTPTEEKSYF